MAIAILNTNSSDNFDNPTIMFLQKELSKKQKVYLFFPYDKTIPEDNRKDIVWLPRYNIIDKPKKLFHRLVFWKKYIELKKYIEKEKINTIIAVDGWSLIIAGRLRQIGLKCRIDFISFEIFFTKELSHNKIVLKRKEKEIYFSKYIDHLVIQDEERLKQLVNENKLLKYKYHTYLIPCAPLTYLSKENSIDWRDKLNIPKSKKVIVYSGSIALWSGAKQIIDLIKSGLPEDYLILIQNRSIKRFNNQYSKELEVLQEQGYQVIIHNTRFETLEELWSFLSCFDYGLALYELDHTSYYTGDNIKYMGLSTTKFTTYMSLGLPTFITHSPILEKFNKDFNFGILIDDTAHLIQAIKSKEIEKISSKNCIDFYNKILNPEVTAKEYINSFK